MGGGPSREEREAQRRLEEQNRRLEDERRQAQAQATQFITLANQEDPLEARLRERDMKWFDWEEGKNGPRDVMNAPLGAGLDLYTNAINRQEGQRHGIGALQLGLNESNPMLTQLLDQQSRDLRQQDAAGGLEQAVRLRSAEANRSALPLADFAQSRRMGLASLASGSANAAANNAANATNSYLQFLTRPRRPSFWQQMIGAGSQVASAKLAFGCVEISTPILTPSGFVPLANLNEGDLVIGVSSSGEKVPLPIVRKRVKKQSSILRIENAVGDSIECSPSDRIMFSVDDRAEIVARELSEGERVAGTTVKSIEDVPEKKTVAIIKLENHHENFGFISKAFLHLDDYAVRAVH